MFNVFHIFAVVSSASILSQQLLIPLYFYFSSSDLISGQREDCPRHFSLPADVYGSLRGAPLTLGGGFQGEKAAILRGRVKRREPERSDEHIDSCDNED